MPHYQMPQAVTKPRYLTSWDENGVAVYSGKNTAVMHKYIFCRVSASIPDLSCDC